MKKAAAAPGTFIHSADDKLISISAAADKMGVTTRTVREMLSRWPAFRIHLRARVVPHLAE